jgi:hypothetical protein
MVEQPCVSQPQGEFLPAIRIRDLTKTFGTLTAIDNV